MTYAVELQNVSKHYRIYSRNRDRLREVLSFGRVDRGHDFWALKDVDLKIEPGTSLGLLGRNGAGKSTMLQVISGVLQPSNGVVSVRGRIAALLQLGAGFKSEFTGRENAVMNGLLLGIDRREMLERFDEIEAFADIGEFMDQPVKNYSSGMRARLGFAVAVNVDPEVLLVDEALSVGDGVFKHMGIRKMRELQETGATIVFVSHSSSQVKSFCNEAALLHKGRLLAHGTTSEVVDEYDALLASEAADGEDFEDPDYGGPSLKEDPALKQRGNLLRRGSGEARIQNVEVLDHRGVPVESADPNSPLTVRIHARYEEDVDESSFDFTLRNRAGLDMFSTGTRPENAPPVTARAGDATIVDFTFVPSLHAGPYSVAAGISAKNGSTLDWIDVATAFKIDRPEGRPSYGGLAHLPTEVAIHQPERAGNTERPA